MSERLTTRGGAIAVRGTSGRVRAQTGGGSVRMLASEAREVAAVTGGGSVTGTFAAVPGLLRYETGGGKRTVTVPTDGAAPHRVTMRTGGGDVPVLRVRHPGT